MPKNATKMYKRRDIYYKFEFNPGMNKKEIKKKKNLNPFLYYPNFFSFNRENCVNMEQNFNNTPVLTTQF